MLPGLQLELDRALFSVAERERGGATAQALEQLPILFLSVLEVVQRRRHIAFARWQTPDLEAPVSISAGGADKPRRRRPLRRVFGEDQDVVIANLAVRLDGAGDRRHPIGHDHAKRSALATQI